MSLEDLSLGDLPEELLAAAQRLSPAGVFYHRRLLELWQSVHGWKLHALCDGSALMIGLQKDTPLGQVYYSLPFGWYGGFVGEGARPEFSTAVFEWLRSQRFIQENIVQFGSPYNTSFPSRYHRRDLTTHILDLRAESAYSTNIARNLKKAVGRGLITKPLTGANGAAFALLRHEHVARTGETRKLSDQFYDGLFSVSQAIESGVAIVGAFADDELVASHIYLDTASDIFYLDGFSSQIGLDLSANFLLLDQAISKGREVGAQRLNFGASPADDAGLARFKVGWGAKPVSYREYSWRSFVKGALDMLRGRS